MTSPVGDTSRSTPDEVGRVDQNGRIADVDSVAGIDIADPALAESIRAGMIRVEKLLHDSVDSDLDFARRASRHLVDAGGKRFRPLFTLLAAQFGSMSDHENVIKSAATIELVHLATLYHDDVMDEATMRRGASSANARWDNSVAILTGDFLFAQASKLASELGTDATRMLAVTFEALVTGQMRETVGAEDGEDKVKHYLTVINEKTGSLIATASQFGARFAECSRDHVFALERIGSIIGTGFQISDDIIDIASPSAESGKTPGTDLREGVRTLPMLYALTDESGDSRLRELLSGTLQRDEDVNEALGRLRASDGLLRARSTLDEHAAQARNELAMLPQCPAREAMYGLVDYVVARTR